MADDLNRVVPLDELDDYKVAEGDPDVRGWEVISSDGTTIGEVSQLLVDRSAMKVRYLDVDLRNDALEGADRDRHILVPIGYARLHEEDDQVLIDQMDSTRIRALPAYAREPVTREFEATLVKAYDPASTATGADLYEHRLYDDSRFYGTRRT